MKRPARLLLWLVAALASCGAVAATAKDSRTYFVARAQADGAPRQLSDSDAAYYGAVFRAIDTQQWALAQQMLGERQPGLLHPVAWAELYLAANSPRVELPQIQAWLETGSNLPQAAQLSRLALTRGATQLAALPVERDVYPHSSAPKRALPAPVDDGTMPAELRASILDRIVNDDPDGARLVLDGIDASLSPYARAEWRQRVAWSYYIENLDRQALAMAQTASQGSGAWVAEGEWVAGLAAWRLNDCAAAQDSFQRAAFGATNPELRTAAFYWGSRAALRCREPDLATKLLVSAAGDDQSLYGMLAAEQLGRALPARLARADLSPEDWRRIGTIENVRVAVALAQIGRDELASEVLLHQARIGDPADYAALSRLARELCLPQTQLYMAYNAPTGASADPASFYPTPKWAPVDGWRVDPALAYAHTLQESNFRASAVSQADARGLMQITPITVRQHAPQPQPEREPGRHLRPRHQPRLRTAEPGDVARQPGHQRHAAQDHGRLQCRPHPGDPLERPGPLPGRSAALHGIDPLLGNARLRRGRDAQLLDVRATGRCRFAQPRGAGAERVADVSRGCLAGGRPRLPLGGRALMAIDEARSFTPINIALLTVSDTRGPDEDTSGDILAQRIAAAGHTLAARALLKDDADLIAAQLEMWIEDASVDAVVSTGGTGLTGRDVTPEALGRLREAREIPGFGELFRWVSYQTIGTSTVQSRALAVVARGTYIFALPGSNGAVKDGWDRILAEQLDSRNRPCNFVELMPRLMER